MRKLLIILLLTILSTSITGCSENKNKEIILTKPSDNFMDLLNEPKYEKDGMEFICINKVNYYVKAYTNNCVRSLKFNKDKRVFSANSTNIIVTNLQTNEISTYIEDAEFDDIVSFAQLIMDTYCPNEEFYSVVDTLEMVSKLIDVVPTYREYIRYDKIYYDIYITVEQLKSDEKLVTLLNNINGSDYVDSLTSRDEICIKIYSDVLYEYFYPWMYLEINGSKVLQTQIN